MLKTLQAQFSTIPFLSDYSEYAALLVAVLIIIFAAIASNWLARFVIERIINRLLKSSASERDDILVKHNVFGRLSQFAPAIVIYTLAPAVLGDMEMLAAIISRLSVAYMVVIAVLFFDGLINALVEIYGTFRIAKELPVTSFAQAAKLLLYFVGFVSLVSIVLDRSPATLLAGLSALAAVLTFVFKDLILGFVSGLQLSANRMVSVGDWIEMPSFNVDGDIMEIGLTTVKIRNFDKTITTVPTQTLINESFKNWRGMTETGGRRIKRSVVIDINTIRFCDAKMLERYAKIQFIADYLNNKREEITAYNADAGVDEAALVNGRRLTNVGTFRAYIEAYLRNHPQISKSLTLLVRQLQPTDHGLPIEIYVFSLDTDWINYEKIQADIFDHILAAAREFDLRIFQHPSGADFSGAFAHSTA